MSAVGYSETERATLDARNTAGISFMDLPSGYDFAYASGREDNPLGIAPALAVPEISTAAMSVGGLLVIGICLFRRRRQKQ